MQLQVGDEFDEFQVLTKIGAGSFSSVYLAHDTVLDRKVVLKQLSPELSSNDDEWDAFINEAQVTASFFHPGLLTVHALRVDVKMSSAVLVLEYMDGGTLRDILDIQGKLTVNQVWNLAYQIGDALHYIHQRGMIHRDIKPENILYSTETEWYKLSDFGLLYNPQRPQFEALNNGQPGTLKYMSPEQTIGDFIDHRSDQYALAAVIQEALTGRYYLGINDADLEDDELTAYIQQGFPGGLPMLHHDPVLMDKLEDVLLRGLAKAPEERFPTTSRFTRRLIRVLEYMISSQDSPV